MEHWQCISGCGACCRLDPAQRGDDLERLDPDQRNLYLEMVGPDGWCRHFDTGARRCRIYESRPDFCRVQNLVALFSEAAPEPGRSGRSEADLTESEGRGMDPAAQALAIACCRTQIRAEYGGRGRVLKRFERAIRREP